MRAATRPRLRSEAARLLFVDRARGLFADRALGALPELLAPGDLLVVNDAATLPASLRGVLGGESVELRLASELGHGRFTAVLFGAGDWRTRTEDRAAPPRVTAGDVIAMGPGFSARVLSVAALSPRLCDIELSAHGAALWAALYRYGRPVQYAYLERELALWDVQNHFAARPWAFEAPSAALGLDWQLCARLRERRIGLARVTHAAGLSSTGDAAIDAALPFPERYDVPARTVAQIAAARAAGARVVAVGTTVARALEGAAARHGGELVAGEGVTGLRLGPATELRVVDGLLTGMHEAGTSHDLLMQAFAPLAALRAAQALASERGYLGHEFGDAMLIV